MAVISADSARSGDQASQHQETKRAQWDDFLSPRSSGAFLTSWFSLLSREIDGLAASVLLLEKQDGGFARATGWHLEGKQPEDQTASALEDACRNALTSRTVCVEDGPDGGRIVGYPVLVDDTVQALIGLILTSKTNRLDEVFQRLQWGCGWLHGIVHRRRADQSDAARERAGSALTVLAALEDAEGLEACLRAFVNDTLRLMSSDRAAISLVQRGKLRIRAISHAADIDQRSGESRSLTQAMEEARSQLGATVYPPLPGDVVPIVAAHVAHAARAGAVSILSFPIFVRDTCIGIVSVERLTASDEGSDAFDQDDRERLEQIGALCGPIIELKQREHRLISGRFPKFLGKAARALFGARHPGLKILVAVLILVVAFLSVLRTDMRVTASATLRGESQRVAVAPFDGYIGEVIKRAGDMVVAGEVLATLDDRDLRLEALKWQSERNQLIGEQRQALAEGDRVAMAATAARIARAEAELSLVEAELARIKISAPHDGLIVEGDLSQRLGAPVREGDVLFEIASAESYKVVIDVGEYDIRHVRPDATGTLALSGYSGQPLDVRVTRIASVSRAENGQNAFRVEARLLSSPDGMRPGLQGVAKLDAGETSWLYAVARPLIVRLRIVIWRWLP